MSVYTVTDVPEQDGLFVGLPSQKDIVAWFIVTGEPVSKARARFTKYGSHVQAYTPEKTRTAEQQMSHEFRAAGGRLSDDKDMTFGVSATFYNGTRQRRDVDNMLKLVLDALNGVAWIDDNQVIEVAGRKRYVDTAAAAHTEVVVYRCGRRPRRAATCEWCKKKYETWPSWSGRVKYCSRACGNEARRAARARVCVQCGADFFAHSPSHERKYCSTACKSAAAAVTVACSGCGTLFVRLQCHVADKNWCTAECRDAHRVASTDPSRRARGTCLDCGVPKSRAEYVRCRTCAEKARAAK